MPEVTLAALRAEHARERRAEQREPANARLREQAEDLRRDYAAAKLFEHIAAIVAAAPPLTDEQRDRLSLRLVAVPDDTRAQGPHPAKTSAPPARADKRTGQTRAVRAVDGGSR